MFLCLNGWCLAALSLTFELLYGVSLTQSKGADEQVEHRTHNHV